MKAANELNYKHKILGMSKNGLASVLTIFLILVGIGIHGIYLFLLTFITFSVFIWFEFNRPSGHIWHFVKSLVFKKEFLHAKISKI